MRLAFRYPAARAMNFRLTAFVSVSCLVHAGLLWSDLRPLPVAPIGGEASALRVTLAPPEPSPPDSRPPATRPAAPTPRTPPPSDSRVAHASARTAVAPIEPMPQHAGTELAPSEPLPRHAGAESPPSEPLPRHAGTESPPSESLPQHAAVELPPSEPPRRPATKAQRDRPASPQRLAQAPAPASAASPQSSSLSVSDRVSAALQDQLEEVFAYPWLARKRGWQGSVMLSLHVDRNGTLSGWKVVQTSGYRLLDRSALQAARRIRQLQQADRLLDGRPLNLSIPVRYQLLDG